MKKFAYMIAALSLCACTFTACGGDDKDDDKGSDKAAIGADCEKASDCASNYCSDEKKCAEKQEGEANPCKGKADGTACGDNKECKAEACVEKEGGEANPCKDKADGTACGDNKECKAEACVEKEGDDADPACKGKAVGDFCADDESKICDEALKCIEVAPEVECEKASFVAMCDLNQEGLLLSACDDNNKIVKVDCTANTDGKTACYNGACVQPNGHEDECSVDTDCKDSAKPYCSDEHKCVAEKTDANSCGECTAGTCQIDNDKVDAELPHIIAKLNGVE